MNESVAAGEPQTPSRRRRVFKNVFVTLLYFFSITLGGLFGFFLSYLNKLPQLEQAEKFQPIIPSAVLTEDGQPVEEFAIEKRVLMHSINEMSPNLKNAIIAVEDSHFFEHPGVDPWGILRALYVNLRTGHVVEGGSTLTQQLAKMLFLKPEKTIERKIQEAMLAVQLERRYTKEEVLVLYCNQVYLGHGVYGVQAAANYYFGKSAKDLSIDESALLAALPKAPQDFSPYLHPDRALARRNHVLTRMMEEKYITKQQCAAASKLPLRVRQILPRKLVAPYYTEEIRQYLEGRYGYAGIYENGLRVYSTLDLNLQKLAESAVDRGIRRIDKRHAGFRKIGTNLSAEQMAGYWAPSWSGNYQPDSVVKGLVTQVTDRTAMIRIADQEVPLLPKGWEWTHKNAATALLKVGDLTDFRILEMKDDKIATIALDQPPLLDGALIAMDLKTGKIRALVGGSDFTSKKFDRAIQAWRQCGSAFKPFIYAAAFESGLTPSDIMVDAPISFYDPWSHQTWSPHNYTNDYLGAMTLRRALELSRNTIAVKVLEKIGVKYAIQYINRFEVAKDMQPYLPLALGASESTLINMVRGYGAFGNQGLMMEPMFVDKILDRDGNLVEENLPRAKEVMRADIAYLMTDVLQGVIQHGTAIKARVLKRPIAGKTGTTNDYTDAWFIGYTPSMICGVWVGYDEKKTIGNHETGAEAALPIWIDFMQKALGGKPVEEFQATGNIVRVAIDRLTGLRATPDCIDVIIEGFVAGTEPTGFCGPEHHKGVIPLQDEEMESSESPRATQSQPQSQPGVQ